jgi:hypothetical protein
MILFGSTYTIKRNQPNGYYDNSGKYIDGIVIPDFTVEADCQSMSAKELESLNIGKDNLGKIKVFCDTELILAIPGKDGNNLQDGDRVVFLSNEYEIIQRLPFVNNIIPHFEYIAEYRES